MTSPISRPGCPPWCGKGPAAHTVCSAPAPMIRLASGAETSARARRSLAFGEHVLVSGISGVHATDPEDAACLATLLDVLAEATPGQHHELARQVREAARLLGWEDAGTPDGGTAYARPVPAREYTHPDVPALGVAQGRAEAEVDLTRIDWPLRQARAAIPFEVIDGRPVNPCEKTGITRGRSEMGFWGEQKMADALVTCTYRGIRHLLMIERGDGYGWAVPGGHVEPGETGLHAAVRELAEETGLDARGWPFTVFREMPPRYVPDPRSSDEAWAVTVPVHVDLGERDTIPVAVGADDARRAEWMPANSYSQLSGFLGAYFGGRVFAAHVAMLGDFLGGVAS